MGRTVNGQSEGALGSREVEGAPLERCVRPWDRPSLAVMSEDQSKSRGRLTSHSRSPVALAREATGVWWTGARL